MLVCFEGREAAPGLFPALLGLRVRRRKDFAEQGKHVRDAEGLLQKAGFAARRSFRPGIGQVAGHVDDGRLLRTDGGEDLGGGLAAVDKKAASREMQVAKKNIVGAALGPVSLAGRTLGLVASLFASVRKAFEERERLFEGGGAVHAEPLGGKAFVQELAQAFFVVENENAAALEDFDRGRSSVRGVRGKCGS